MNRISLKIIGAHPSTPLRVTLRIQFSYNA